MKTLKLIIPIIIILLPGVLNGEMVSVLEELEKPTIIALDEQQLYVTDKTTVHIYSLKDYKYVKKFGRSGEGPQEFRAMAYVIPQKDRLLIWSPGKISYYSKDGVFQSEKRTKGALGGALFKPLNNNFVGLSQHRGKDGIFTVLNLYDQELNKIKEVKRLKLTDAAASKINLFNGNIPYDAFNGKAYIDTMKGFAIQVVNEKGEELSIIEQKSYKQRQFNDDDEKKIRELISKATPGQYAFIKDRIDWPKYYPAIMIFNIDPGAKKLAVIAWKQENDKHECYIYSLGGKLEKRMLLPMVLQDGIRPFPYAFRDGKFYQVIDNDDEEQWELHAHKLY